MADLTDEQMCREVARKLGIEVETLGQQWACRPDWPFAGMVLEELARKGLLLSLFPPNQWGEWLIVTRTGQAEDVNIKRAIIRATHAALRGAP